MSDSGLSKTHTSLLFYFFIMFALQDNWIPVAEKLSSISPEEIFLLLCMVRQLQLGALHSPISHMAGQ